MPLSLFNPRSIGVLPLLALTTAPFTVAFPQQPADHVVRAYKRVDGDSLVMHVFRPTTASEPRPAILLFHGGAFVWGGPEVTDGVALDYARLGLVAFSVQYRLANRSYFFGLFGGRPGANDLVTSKHVRPPMPPTVMITGALDSVTYEREALVYCASVREARGRCDLHSYPHLGHLLSRRLDRRSQVRGQFEWDVAATNDAHSKVNAFLSSLGLIAVARSR